MLTKQQAKALRAANVARPYRVGKGAGPFNRMVRRLIADLLLEELSWIIVALSIDEPGSVKTRLIYTMPQSQPPMRLIGKEIEMPKSAEERLEKIATYLLSEDLMQKWDTWRRLLVGGHVGSYPRDCFEAEMHGIAEEANSTAAAIREDRAEMVGEADKIIPGLEYAISVLAGHSGMPMREIERVLDEEIRALEAARKVRAG